MNLRRQKLAERIALQGAAAIPQSNHSISEMRTYPVREPASGRAYTLVRLRTSSGLVGWGEAGRVSAADIEKARAAIIGRAATAYAVTSTGTPLDPGDPMRHARHHGQSMFRAGVPPARRTDAIQSAGAWRRCTEQPMPSSAHRWRPG